MLRFAADESFSLHIVSGVRRRLPTADMRSTTDFKQGLFRTAHVHSSSNLLAYNSPSCSMMHRRNWSIKPRLPSTLLLIFASAAK